MRKLLLAAILSLSCIPAQAVLIDSGTPIPNGKILLNFNGSGLDWVYAGPLAPNALGPGFIYEPSYRASEGWRAATVTEWASRPIWSDFIVPGQTVTPINNFTDHTSYLFASEYWSDFTNVDLVEFINGEVTDGINGAATHYAAETIYVRSSLQAVPEPAMLGLLGLGVLGMAFSRHKKRTRV